MAPHAPVKCEPWAQGRVFRVTRLGNCGEPVYGDLSQATFTGVATAAIANATVDVEEISATDSDGTTRVIVQAQTRMTGKTVEITFNRVSPELYAMLTGQDVYRNADGVPIGVEHTTEVKLQDSFGFEIWSGIGGEQCDDDGKPVYGYSLLPYLKSGMASDQTFENGLVSFVVTGIASRDGTRWGVGPYNVLSEGGVPAPLPTPLTDLTHQLQIEVNLEPPEPFCGLRPLLDLEADPITSITATPTDGTVALSVTPAPADPVWWDFGDGYWDFVDAPGSTSHTYEESGTYTIRATTNGYDWIEETVTVTVSS